MKYKPYHDVIIKSAKYPNGFPPYYRFFASIRDFKLPHNAAFRCWMRKGFPLLWHGSDLPVDGEVRLATAVLTNTSDVEHARKLILCWWKLHKVEPDENALALTLEIAWALTEEDRTRYEIGKANRERKKAYYKQHKTKRIKAYSAAADIDCMFSPLIGVSTSVREMIVRYLRKNPDSSPKAIAEAINASRKTVRNKLSEMFNRGEAERQTIKAGVEVLYRLKEPATVQG